MLPTVHSLVKYLERPTIIAGLRHFLFVLSPFIWYTAVKQSILPVFGYTSFCDIMRYWLVAIFCMVYLQFVWIIYVSLGICCSIPEYLRHYNNRNKNTNSIKLTIWNQLWRYCINIQRYWEIVNIILYSIAKHIFLRKIQILPTWLKYHNMDAMIFQLSYGLRKAIRFRS